MVTRLPSVRPNLAWTKLADGAVLFVPETEVYYAMNGVAALVWELLPQHAHSIEALCAAVGERFPDATPEQIRDDVGELLDELNRSGLVESMAGESPA
jgi:hypothetical protein